MTRLSTSLTALFSELTDGAPGGGNAFILNSGDAGLLRSLDRLSAAEASAAVYGGATVAAHALHMSYGLSLMNRWAREGGNPFADARWDDAWQTSVVDAGRWSEIRDGLASEVRAWLEALGEERELTTPELKGMISSIGHLAYHFGAIRQIGKGARGPKEGAFT